ncbi:hypothetical protein BD626DRAFT_571555 [Schizophyllum amplum]|uniref:Uncharacterized protein n=1 Tax=Schizophyllum amplum TaxID=97359 RepID=A0A550C7S3_9AGAR|nr:hypothetical protein BD626DRAFT_571555 [Auriculariopsis ampla]
MYRFDLPRLASDADLHDRPVLLFDLAVTLPADATVRAYRVVEPADGEPNGKGETEYWQYIEWSPNSAENRLPFNPGARPPLAGLNWPKIPADAAHRRMDGSLGRFDYTRFPQYGEREVVWSGAVLTRGVEDAYVLELQPVVKHWTCQGSSDHGQFPTNVLNALRTHRVEVETRITAERAALDTAPDCKVIQQLLRAKVLHDGMPDINILERSSKFDDAVDNYAAFCRETLVGEAYSTTCADARNDELVDSDRLDSCPIVSRHAARMGKWINGLHQDWAAFYIRNGYPVYINYRCPFTYCVDAATVAGEVRSDWTGMTLRELDHLDSWRDATADNQWGTREWTTPRSPFNTMTTDTWLVENSNPFNYGWALPGEEISPRRTPESAPRPDQARSRQPTLRPQEAPSTSLVLVDPEGQITYESPVWNRQAYRLDIIEIPPGIYWVRPPRVAALTTDSRGLRRFMMITVYVGDEEVAILRRIGDNSRAAANYVPFVDRENGCLILFPAPLRELPGVTNANEVGVPAPNAFYFELPDSQGFSRQTHPSRWMYPMDSNARIARPGTSPTQPDPATIPWRFTSATDMFTRDPITARMDAYVRDSDDYAVDYEDEDMSWSGTMGETFAPSSTAPSRLPPLTSLPEGQPMDTTEDGRGNVQDAAAPGAGAVPPGPRTPPLPPRGLPTAREGG